MSYHTEHFLEKDEHIVYQYQTANGALLLRIILSLLLLPVCGLGLLIMLYPSHATFTLTDKRVIYRSGGFFKSTQYITLDTLKAVYVTSKQWSFDTVPEYGTVTFEGPGNGIDIIINHMDEPIEFIRKIHEHLGWSAKVLAIIRVPHGLRNTYIEKELYF